MRLVYKVKKVKKEKVVFKVFQVREVLLVQKVLKEKLAYLDFLDLQGNPVYWVLKVNLEMMARKANKANQVLKETQGHLGRLDQ